MAAKSRDLSIKSNMAPKSRDQILVSNPGIKSQDQILVSSPGIKFCSSWGMFWDSDIENVLPILSFKT